MAGADGLGASSLTYMPQLDRWANQLKDAVNGQSTGRSFEYALVSGIEIAPPTPLLPLVLLPPLLSSPPPDLHHSITHHHPSLTASNTSSLADSHSASRTASDAFSLAACGEASVVASDMLGVGPFSPTAIRSYIVSSSNNPDVCAKTSQNKKLTTHRVGLTVSTAPLVLD